MTRVLHVISSAERRGAQVFATDLAAALAALGHDSRTVALVRGATAPHLPVEVLGQGRFGVATLRALRRAAAGVDVVVAHGSSTLPACALALAGARTPFVYRVIGDPTYWSAAPARRLRVRLALRRAARVCALWSAAADTLARSYGVPRSRLAVVPNGVPGARFPAVDASRRAEARRILGLPDTGPVAAYVGSLTPEKRVHLAVEAAGASGLACLLVAGDGPDRGDLEDRAASAAPAGRVRFLGAVADPASVLAAADCLVLPSASEGLPAVLIEAGLSAIPVVATPVGGVGEIVEDGVTGVLVPDPDGSSFARAIDRAVADRDSLGAAARVRCLERFEMTPVAHAWSDLLQAVADSLGPTRGQ